MANSSSNSLSASSWQHHKHTIRLTAGLRVIMKCKGLLAALLPMTQLPMHTSWQVPQPQELSARKSTCHVARDGSERHCTPAAKGCLVDNPWQNCYCQCYMTLLVSAAGSNAGPSSVEGLEGNGSLECVKELALTIAFVNIA